MLVSAKWQTFHFSKLASFVNDLKETRFLGEIIVDEVDEAVATDHLVEDLMRLGVLGIQRTPLLPPQLKCLVLMHNSMCTVVLQTMPTQRTFQCIKTTYIHLVHIYGITSQIFIGIINIIVVNHSNALSSSQFHQPMCSAEYGSSVIND